MRAPVFALSVALVLALAASLVGAPAQASTPAKAKIGQILSAQYAEPVTGLDGPPLFGDHTRDWRVLEITVKTGKRKKDEQVRRFQLPYARVFRDIEPRLADLNGDGMPEVITVESHTDFGARLAVYDADGFVTANDWIGVHNAWLAPVGAIDIDGDGAVEIAYVDRPHVNKVLSILRYADRHLSDVIEITPFTDHRMGDDFITGGARTCRGTPAFVVGNGDLGQLVEVGWAGGQPNVRTLGPNKGPASLAHALACKAP